MNCKIVEIPTAREHPEQFPCSHYSWINLKGYPMNLLRLFELVPLPAGATRPRSSVTFDGIYALLAALFTGGLVWDIWSHDTFGPDQSVFSQYHLLFYSALATLGLWLIAVIGRNLRAGLPRYAALPRGYGLAFLAVLLFGLAGTLDLIGHALFGFEVELEALLSPTHVPLFITWFVIAAGPLRVALKASEDDGKQLGFAVMIPSFISFACALMAIFITTLAFSPIGGYGNTMLNVMRPDDGFVGEALGVMGIFIQTLVLIGPTIWLVSRLKLPFGSLSAVYTLLGLLMLIVSPENLVWLPLFFTVGLTLDLLLSALELWRSAARFRVFGFLSPLVLWGFFFAYAISFLGGIWFRPYIWLEVFVESMVVGFLLAHLIVSRPRLTPNTLAESRRDVADNDTRAYAGSGD